MVNTGRPSRGCQVCRKRKIKCDEALPGCSYCLKKKVVCPGYQDAFDLAFRDQRIVAEKSVQRRKKATGGRFHQTTSFPPGSNSSFVPDLLKKSSTSLLKCPSHVPAPISENYTEYALEFLYSSYLSLPRPPEVRQGYLELLHPIYMSSDISSPLRPATYAVGSFLLEAWIFRSPREYISTPRPFYLKALSMLRAILTDQDAIITDDILMAVLILEMYEGLISFFKGTHSQGTHVSGGVALIQNRKSKLSQEMLCAVRNNMIDTALQTSQPIPPIVSAWKNMVVDLPRNASIRLDGIDIRVANVQAFAASELPTIDMFSDSGPRTLHKLLRAATDIDADMVAWFRSIPDSWIPVCVSGPEAIPPSVTAAGLYGEQCDIYSDVFVANTLNRYRCSRNRLHSIIIACHDKFPGKENSSATASSVETIQENVDDICRSLPFFLGDQTVRGRLDAVIRYPSIPHKPLPAKHSVAAPALGGWFLITRLNDVNAIKCRLRDGQQEWIRSQMMRLIEVYGIEPPLQPRAG